MHSVTRGNIGFPQNKEGKWSKMTVEELMTWQLIVC